MHYPYVLNWSVTKVVYYVKFALRVMINDRGYGKMPGLVTHC